MRQVWGPLELDLGGLSLPLLCPKCVAADVRAEKLIHGQKDLALLSEAPSLRDRRGGDAGSPLPPGSCLLGKRETWTRAWP